LALPPIGPDPSDCVAALGVESTVGGRKASVGSPRYPAEAGAALGPLAEAMPVQLDTPGRGEAPCRPRASDRPGRLRRRVEAVGGEAAACQADAPVPEVELTMAVGFVAASGDPLHPPVTP
jgi:hypothetical protein